MASQCFSNHIHRTPCGRFAFPAGTGGLLPETSYSLAISHPDYPVFVLHQGEPRSDPSQPFRASDCKEKA